MEKQSQLCNQLILETQLLTFAEEEGTEMAFALSAFWETKR
jgi:hypothetical protein